MAGIVSRINLRLVMRLLPMNPDKPWRSIKAQWKKDAESVGEDFSTFSTGSYAAFDALTKDGEAELKRLAPGAKEALNAPEATIGQIKGELGS